MKLTERQKEIRAAIEAFLTDHGYPPSIRELAAQFSMASSSMLGHIRALERKEVIRRKRGKSRSVELLQKEGLGGAVKIPVLGRVAAGPPILAEENLEGSVIVDPSLVRGSTLFALKIEGDSMVDAGIREGDLCIVQMAETADKGDIVVALVDGEATVKRFNMADHEILLVPENRAYQPIRITENHHDFRILGKVVGLYRKL